MREPVKVLSICADTGRASAEVSTANRPRGRGAKPRGSTRVSRAATSGRRDRGAWHTDVQVQTIPYRRAHFMLHKLRQRAQEEKGFTLIELLVVILIIGILAAIALPAFLNQREKAQDSAAKSDVRTAQTAMETYYTDTQKYTGATKGALVAIEPALNDVTGLDVGTPTDTAYT